MNKIKIIKKVSIIV